MRAADVLQLYTTIPKCFAFQKLLCGVGSCIQQAPNAAQVSKGCVTIATAKWPYVLQTDEGCVSLMTACNILGKCLAEQ